MSETLAKCARAVIEPLLISHFGEGVTEEVWVIFYKDTSGVSSELNSVDRDNA
ncbi:SAM-dependent carboxyl methyltransferase [Medicago truncatula]|uniref:SAM-dependent carboxyl methyltransferase n=1 Tax=Medicago truncatula TaxID=3880 RepID=A0A072UKY6_MEDTR|nr:SAM-dependent carboxyl methyltransferase [Medicago truncatula]